MESRLYDKIVEAMKVAMKSHDNTKRDCLRAVMSDIKNITVNAGKEITDDACMKMLQKSVKTHNDSIEQFEKAGRHDLASKEKAELDAISAFLPKTLSIEEIEQIAKDVLSKVSNDLKRSLAKKDMGLVMKAISMHEKAQSIAMKDASRIVASLLA